MQQVRALLRCPGAFAEFAASLDRQQLIACCLPPAVCLSTALHQQKQPACVHTSPEASFLPNPQPAPVTVPLGSFITFPSLHFARQSWASAAVEARTQGACTPHCHGSRSYAKKRRPGPAPRPLQQQQQQDQDASHAQPLNEMAQTADQTAAQISEPGAAIQASETSASNSDIARVVGHPALIISRAIEWYVLINQSRSDPIPWSASHAMMLVTEVNHSGSLSASYPVHRILRHST